MRGGAVVGAAVAVIAATAIAVPSAVADKNCSDFSNQADAQRVLDRDRSDPNGLDGDGNGKGCESLPCPCGSGGGGGGGGDGDKPNNRGCDTPKRVREIEFSRRRYPNIIKHIKRSYRLGYPRKLKINRDGADRRRDKLLSRTDSQGRLLFPTRSGFDREEAPAAVLRKKVDASVMYVPSSENRSAGASLGNQIEGLCDGVRVRYDFDR